MPSLGHAVVPCATALYCAALRRMSPWRTAPHGTQPFTDGGHDCPFKNSVESPWVLTAIKLYAQQGANPKSMCAQMMYAHNAMHAIKHTNERICARRCV